MPEDKKRNVTKLRKEPCEQLFECRVREVMSDDNIDLWRSFEQRVLLACDEVCEYKKNWKCNVNTWWWNSV